MVKQSFFNGIMNDFAFLFVMYYFVSDDAKIMQEKECEGMEPFSGWFGVVRRKKRAMPAVGAWP